MQATPDIHSYSDTVSRGRVASVRIPLSIALLFAGFAGMSVLPAAAQVAASTPEVTTASPDAIKQREQELEATRAQQKNAAESQQRPRADLEATGQDRSKRNQRPRRIDSPVRAV